MTRRRREEGQSLLERISDASLTVKKGRDYCIMPGSPRCASRQSVGESDQLLLKVAQLCYVSSNEAGCKCCNLLKGRSKALIAFAQRKQSASVAFARTTERDVADLLEIRQVQRNEPLSAIFETKFVQR